MLDAEDIETIRSVVAPLVLRGISIGVGVLAAAGTLGLAVRLFRLAVGF